MSNPWDCFEELPLLDGLNHELIYNGLDRFEQDALKHWGDARVSEILIKGLAYLQRGHPELFTRPGDALDIPGMTAKALSGLIQGADRELVISAAIERGRRLERLQLNVYVGNVLRDHLSQPGTYKVDDALRNLAHHMRLVIEAGKYVLFQKPPEPEAGTKPC